MNSQTKGANSQRRFSIVPFDPEKDRLPVGFLGHSAADLYSSLLPKENYFQKSDFETQATYNARLDQFSHARLSNGMRADDLFAFIITPEVSYDAETERMTVQLSSLDSVSLAGDTSICKWLETTRSAGSYVGSNAFGVKKIIRRVYTTRYNVVFDRPAWLDVDYKTSENYHSTGGFLLKQEPGPKALFSSRSLRVVLIGPLEPPFISHTTDAEEPTVSDPVDLTTVVRNLHMGVTDVWLVNWLTGEVVKRYGNPENAASH